MLAHEKKIVILALTRTAMLALTVTLILTQALTIIEKLEESKDAPIRLVFAFLLPLSNSYFYGSVQICTC